MFLNKQTPLTSQVNHSETIELLLLLNFLLVLKNCFEVYMYMYIYITSKEALFSETANICLWQIRDEKKFKLKLHLRDTDSNPKKKEIQGINDNIWAFSTIKNKGENGNWNVRHSIFEKPGRKQTIYLICFQWKLSNLLLVIASFKFCKITIIVSLPAGRDRSS